MKITRQTVAGKLTSYLQHEITLDELVEWAENAMMEGEFAEEGFEDTRDVVARLGVTDVRAFGLTWEDCEALLRKLGYSTHIEVTSD